MSLYIAEIRLTSWLCYRGEHQAALGPGVFAVTAERDGDPRRSNAQGKSALFWAVRFALSGDHPHRTEDEWITDGEPEGGVDLELSDGTFISRWRKRGDATRLKVIARDEDGVAAARDGELVRNLELHGDEAQKRVDRLLGVSRKEYASTWWCEQGGADLFVGGEPGEATEAVVRWCGLEKVRAAAKVVADELAGLLRGDARLLAVEEQAARESAELAARLPPDWDAWERPRLEALEGLRLLAAEGAGEAARRRERDRLLRESKQWQSLDEERRRLEQVPPAPKEIYKAEVDADQARADARGAQDDLRSRERVSRGEFDGHCPVAGIRCPAVAEVNRDVPMLRQRAEDARRRLEQARVVAVEKDGLLTRLREQRDAATYAARRLAEIVPELVRLEPSRDAFAALPLGDAGGDVDPGLGQRIAQAEAELEAARALRARREDAAAREREAAGSRTALAPDIAARREALQVLGPAGAQRRVAERFLEGVERRVAEDLAEAGADLRVRFSWQRELPDLADACATCGQPLPSSRKVRACEACGAARGRKLEQKLRCEVRPRSGGMLAVAGVAVRLATTAWLRARRGSAWAVAVLDEPLAYVDQHHRALVGRRLAAMLSGRHGVEQAFVSAHDPGLLAALPRRIVVRGSASGSTFEVVA